MRAIQFFIFCFLISSTAVAQDSLLIDSAFTEKDSVNRKKWQFMIHTDLFSKHTSGLGFIYTSEKVIFTFGLGLSHKQFFNIKDSIASTLPYASNSNTLFYEVRSYSNQKYFFRAGIESNFPKRKNGGMINAGLNVLMGTYHFQDYYADIYYEFFRDTITGEMYYEDMYGDPSWNIQDAFAQVRNFSKAEMDFNTLGFEPYISIANESDKKINMIAYIGCKYELFFVADGYYFDYAGVLESPNENFEKFSWFFRMAMTYDLF